MVALSRLQGLTQSVAFKAPVRVASTAAIAELTGLLIVDGVQTVAGDRVLVKDQASAIENGIYAVDSGDWSRDLDFNGPSDAVQGTLVLVVAGTNGNTVYQLTTASPVIGTTALAFAVTGADALALASAWMIANLFPATTQAAARTALDVPSNAEAILKTLADADGDLFVGTGPNTVARLARGTIAQVLGIVGTALTWITVDLATMVSGLLPLGSMPVGTVINRAYAEYKANADLTTFIPADDTPPQVGEGTQIISLAITTTGANKVHLRFTGAATNGGGVPDTYGVAFFRNGAANAIASRTVANSDNNYNIETDLEFEDTPGAAGTYTYTVRVGATGTTMRMNGTMSGRLHGGTSVCSLVAEEIKQ